MSTDYDVVCDVCKLTMHSGQRMGGKQSFGYGPNDSEGMQRVADFIGAHIWCDLPHGVRIVVNDQPNDEDGTKGYHHVNDDDPADVARALQTPETTWVACANCGGRNLSLHECFRCSSKPGSPTLCDECLKRRVAAGDNWCGPWR